jgi:hypothetical protein
MLSNALRLPGCDALHLEKSCDKRILSRLREFFLAQQQSSSSDSQKEGGEDEAFSLDSAIDQLIPREEVADYWDCFLHHQMNLGHSASSSSSSAVVSPTRSLEELQKYQILLTKCEKAFIQSNLTVWREILSSSTAASSSSAIHRGHSLFHCIHRGEGKEEENEDEQMFLLMKDDAVFNHSLFQAHSSVQCVTPSNYLRQLLLALPSDCDVLVLGGEFPSSSGGNGKQSIYQFKEVPWKKFFFKINYLNSCHGYLIRRRTIQRIFREFLPINKPFDLFLASLLFQEELNVSTPSPPPSPSYSHPSDLVLSRLFRDTR